MTQPNPSEAMLVRELSSCGPRTLAAIKEIYRAFKTLADNNMPNDMIMKKAIGVAAAFQHNVDQLRKNKSPVIIS